MNNLLIKYKFKQKNFYFSTAENTAEKNTFTVIVGKNGTGKSRLMKSIIEEFIGKTPRSGVLRSRHSLPKQLFQETVFENIEIEKRPNKIIAVSTSPFDKFPLDLYGDTHDKYTYLGLRSLRATDLGMAYMANIYISLLKSVIEDSARVDKICEVLGFLGYSPKIRASYHLEFPIKRVQEALNSSNPVEHFIEHILSDGNRPVMRSRIREFFDDDRNIEISKVERVLDIYSRMDLSNVKPRVEVYLEEGGIYLPTNIIGDIKDFFFLADLGIARLREINLEKNNGKNFRIGDASSGEQSVVMSVLGIASQICDDSLICIDEPEVCLHPEWQEKYIDILINTFKNFTGCHFLIATHSPLMVSKLQDRNCYLLKMENGEVTPASEINRKSVDFQLANTFKTPGYKNEYLTRELISVLTMFGETGKIDDVEKGKLVTLLSLKEQVEKSDPVHKLMEMAQEALMESL